jgi:hypothetical protein
MPAAVLAAIHGTVVRTDANCRPTVTDPDGDLRIRRRDQDWLVGNAPRVSSVTFSLSVGTVVPRTVKYVPLPPRVVEIYPAWRGYHYFIVGDQIVIVESGSLRIVAVIPA